MIVAFRPKGDTRFLNDSLSSGNNDDQNEVRNQDHTMVEIESRVLWLWMIVGCWLASTQGCGNSNASSETKTPSPVKVEIGTPIEKEVVDFRDFTGRLEAVKSVEIRARVSGYLTKIAFDESIELGAEVNENDLLFEIDKRPYTIALASATAQLANAEAKLKTSSAELARTELLFAKGASTQSDLDRDTGAKLLSQAEIDAAHASIAQAELDLEFAAIKAPISGRISRSIPSEGDLITPSSGPLTTIVSVDPMHVYFDMDEPTLQSLQKLIRAGKLKGPMDGEVPLMMGLTTDEDYPYQGKLDFVENKVDPNTGTIRVRGVFTNPKSKVGGRPLAPGFFARVRLPLGEPHQAVLVSERTIGRDQGQSFVYVVDAENVVVYRRVKLGTLHDGMRVITEGLAANERIVTNGLQRVRPGIKVEAKTEAGERG